MGTMVSSQVLNMIIYILMVLQKPWLTAKKGRQKLVILSFLFSFFFHIDTRYENTWAMQKVQQGGSLERGAVEQLNNSGAIIVLQGQRDLLVPEKPSAMMRKNFRSVLSG